MTPENIAARFVQARLAGRSIPDYPGGQIPIDLQFAYRVQEAALETWPDQIRGWKIARIGPQWRTQYDEERLIGPVFGPNVQVVRSGEVAVCPVFQGGLAAVEAEIGIYVDADAPADKTDWTPESAAALVRSVHIGVEMAGSPLATLNDLGPGAVISDFGNNWGVIVGAEIPDWRVHRDLEAETFIEGKSVGRGPIAIPETPLSAFAFALNKAASRGRPLRAGHYLSTGLITGVHDIRVGQSSRVTFAQYGEILLRTVPALNYVPGK
ncbi:MAG: 2-keto-4-pentenoate hydratase [Povalibacter sp.]